MNERPPGKRLERTGVVTDLHHGLLFGNGSVLVLPTIALAFALGVVAGFRASTRLRAVLLVLAVLSLGFWVFVSDGWWVHPPPRKS